MAQNIISEGSTPEAQRPAIGLIGLGLVGQALTQRWRKAGYCVRGFDLNEACCETFYGHGGRVAANAAAVAQTCHPVVLSLPDSEIVRTVVADLLPLLANRRGALLIDTTTGDPTSARELSQSAGQAGVEWVTATLIGSSQQIAEGRATLLTGGQASDWPETHSVLSAITTEIVSTGSAERAAQMKLVINLVLGLQRAVLAEALALARGFGWDLTETLHILRKTPAYASVMDTKGPRMVHGDDDVPQARLAQHWKDVQLMLDGGRDTGTPLPLTQCHEEILRRLVDAGFGLRDNSAIFRGWEVGSNAGASVVSRAADEPRCDN